MPSIVQSILATHIHLSVSHVSDFIQRCDANITIYDMNIFFAISMGSFHGDSWWPKTESPWNDPMDMAKKIFMGRVLRILISGVDREVICVANIHNWNQVVDCHPAASTFLWIIHHPISSQVLLGIHLSEHGYEIIGVCSCRWTYRSEREIDNTRLHFESSLNVTCRPKRWTDITCRCVTMRFFFLLRFFCSSSSFKALFQHVSQIAPCVGIHLHVSLEYAFHWFFPRHLVVGDSHLSISGHEIFPLLFNYVWTSFFCNFVDFWYTGFTIR